jgi:hypothetical protein
LCIYLLLAQFGIVVYLSTFSPIWYGCVFIYF